jgi:hypothetical protein
MLIGFRAALCALAIGGVAALMVLAVKPPLDGTDRPARGNDRADGWGANGKRPAGAPTRPLLAPLEAETSHEQAQRLMKAVEVILQDAAKNRSEARKLPTDADFMLKPIWAETKEDRERKVGDILDAVLAIVTDAPVVQLQRKIEGLRRNIRELDDRIVALREKQLMAPKDGVLTSMLSETVGSIGREIDEAKARIAANREEIAETKAGIRAALSKNGVELTAEQVDLLLDGVLSGDLVRLVVVFNSARLIDAQLAKLMTASGENIGAARKYFAMHAALFALLVHAQDSLIGKIDRQYLPKLAAIEIDIGNARVRTTELMRADNREDQKRALDANAGSQRLAEDAAKGYRRYLLQQREQVAKARQRTVHDLRIADNTFETVEVSFQLRNLMRDASASFESIQKLEAPTFDQIFKNEELRREFENLTRRLDGPTS